MSLIDVKNLSVEEGERIAITGGSSCGKSVFLRSLELLEVPNCRKIYMACQKLYLFSHMMGLFAFSDYLSHRKEKLA